MSEAAESTNPQGPGAVLHEERRRQNLSLGDVSRQIKLSVRQVEALERDDFGQFGGQVFVHGFVRNYAKLLGLDPDPLLRAVDERLAVVAPAEVHAGETPVIRPRPARKSTLGVIAVLLVLGVVLGVLGLNERRSLSTAPPESKGRESGEPLAAPAGESAPPGQAILSAPAPAVTAEPVKIGVVRMVFEEESWVEIKDRSGNTIFGQLNPAGSQRRASGEAPLTIVVGNAAGVRLTYNDREIDLAPHTRVDVARLTLE
ncbi:MAG TPA: helix-turn-helix domain-containing protein [Burkholderiales bacterium]|nr:helix-turn-helix domain-containing protein [Burkholderiales bacterium]